MLIRLGLIRRSRYTGDRIEITEVDGRERPTAEIENARVMGEQERETTLERSSYPQHRVTLVLAHVDVTCKAPVTPQRSLRMQVHVR